MWPVVDGLGFLILVLYNLPIASTGGLFLCSQALRKEKRSLGLSGGKEEEGVIRHFASLQYRMRVVFFLFVALPAVPKKSDFIRNLEQYLGPFFISSIREHCISSYELRFSGDGMSKLL